MGPLGLSIKDHKSLRFLNPGFRLASMYYSNHLRDQRELFSVALSQSELRSLKVSRINI